MQKLLSNSERVGAALMAAVVAKQVAMDTASSQSASEVSEPHFFYISYCGRKATNFQKIKPNYY